MQILEPVSESRNFAKKTGAFDLLTAKTQLFKCLHELKLTYKIWTRMGFLKTLKDKMSDILIEYYKILWNICCSWIFKLK